MSVLLNVYVAYIHQLWFDSRFTLELHRISNILPYFVSCVIAAHNSEFHTQLTGARALSQGHERYHRGTSGITGARAVSQGHERYHMAVLFHTQLTGARVVSYGRVISHTVNRGTSGIIWLCYFAAKLLTIEFWCEGVNTWTCERKPITDFLVRLWQKFVHFP